MKPLVGSFIEPQVDRRKFVLGLLFCSAAGLAALRLPNKHRDYLGKQRLDELVPKSIGPWNFVGASGLVVPPKDQLAKALYSQLLTRVYDDGVNAPVMLLMAQNGSQTGVLQVHRPETCYTAGGYAISPVTPHAIPLGNTVLRVNGIDASVDGRTEHVLYWTRVGNRIPESWKQQRIAVAEQNLEGIIPDAILVRVSTVRNDAEGARATLDLFVRTLIASIPADRRPVFVV
jgi:EpsI family protein